GRLRTRTRPTPASASSASSGRPTIGSGDSAAARIADVMTATMRSIVRACVVISIAAAATLGTPSRAASQDRTWEVEVHGGGVFSSTPRGGTTTLPSPGPSGTTPIQGFQPARLVSSWYFGDGALQLNQALASTRLASSVTPLDGVLQSGIAERGGGGA